ncbi:GAP family protein [Mycobacterium kubicae]|uniref:GAP family protein n=1 Tax=Mycobacterium kubicae TaxID=120959 RepID=UPI00163F010F|nr:GAP family protein [Mycobacterium kubicae]
MATNDPVRLVIATFLVTRERPLPNLIAYWIGGAGAGIVVSVAVIFFLRDIAAPMMYSVTSTVGDLTGGYVRVALGVIALLFAVKIAAQMFRRQLVGVPMDAVNPSAVTLQPRTSVVEQLRIALQRLTPPAITRLSARIWHALGAGSPRVSFVAGIMTALPPIEHQAALTTILASHEGLAAQLTAAIMFVLVVMATLEVVLVSYLVSPVKTKNGIARLQNLTRTFGRKLFPLMAGSTGVVLIFSGMGGI